MNWTAERLKKGDRISVSSYGNHISGRVDWGDKLIVVPFCTSVKEGDLVYCKVGSWHGIRILKEFKDGKFMVTEHLEYDAIEIPFENIYGLVVEVIKCTTTDGLVMFDDFEPF